jgi:membrane dipeptidase
MIIVDAHEDIAYNYLCFGRDYRQSPLIHRKREFDQPNSNGVATIGLPDSMLGRVAIVFATLFVSPKGTQASLYDKLSYATPRQAYQLALQQLDYYQRLSDESSKISLIRTLGELDAVLATWEDGKPFGERKQGFVFLMENAEPILEPRQFEEWYERGLRIVGLAWKSNRYTGGTGEPGPLTALGRELLDVMAGYKVVLDVSHIAEEAFDEAIDRYTGPVIASHSNPRRFVDTDRQLSDRMIRQLAERDGVVGVALYKNFLGERWRGVPHRPPLSLVLDVIDYICQLTGSAKHVGLGTDMDGGFGLQEIPEGIDTTGDLLNLATALKQRGYAETDVTAIMGGNMLRKLREALPQT